MKELIIFLADWGDVNVGVILFLMLFSVVISFFHCFILEGLYHWTYKPKWLFAVLEPTLVCLFEVIKPDWGIFALLALFVLTFVLGIVGFTIMPLVMKLKATKVEYQRAGKKMTAFTVGKVTGKYVSGIIAVLAIMFIMGVSLPLIFLLGFIIIPLFVLRNPGGDRRFMRLQAILPTSPIRSVAMGLAEVEGNVVLKESLLAPIGDTECVAYQYEVEKIEHNEGRTSYTTVHSENKCNVFSLQDQTGVLDVTPEKLNLLCLPINRQYEKGGKRYTQRLLLPDNQVLLIGMADTRGGQTVFRYEEVKKVYALMPSQALNKYNRSKPLIDALILYTSVFGIIVSLILLLHIEYVDGKLHIALPF
ncbi:hypothetical protein [Bacteroides sp.]|uniref:hypothetical protein n=1 Tax=Bacteroides sp. TaxID=29523 RepID=UPI002A7EFAC9|nr:hypothetical protein [Bacteroides sp.]